MNRLQQTRRQHIGYVYKPQVNNNVGTINYARNPYYVQQHVYEARETGEGGMNGDGFIDTIKSIYDKGKTVSKYIDMAQDAYTGEIGTTLRNALPDSDETARPGFAGEKHAILKLKNGKYGVGNYIGPGTHLVERLKRGDPPRTEVDKVAQAHDIRYFQAKDLGDIRKADNIMINKVKQISRNRGDAPQNIMQANLIRAKVVGENLGVLKKDAFSGNLADNKVIADQNKTMFDAKLSTLSQGGYGFVGAGDERVLPGDALKMKLLKTMARKRKKKHAGAGIQGYNGQSRSRDLGSQYKLMGSGVNLPGGGKSSITNFVVKKVIPSLLSTLNITKSSLPDGMVKTIIGKALDMSKSGNLSTIVSNLSKAILPLITHAKMKGSGNYGGAGITKILGKHKNMLLSNLGKGLLGAFKWHINRSAKAKGHKAVFGGQGMCGGSFANFWKGFKKGFTTVFKPGAKILGTVATAMGQPEIGIPLGMVSNLL
jgi:hypothetical protein